jgi:glutaredoxin
MSTVPSGHEPPAAPQRPRSVVIYHAPDCHLCAAALRVLETVRAEVPFELRTVDVSGDAELERQYREWLPVVEIDGRRAFTYFVQPDALRRRLAQSARSEGTL